MLNIRIFFLKRDIPLNIAHFIDHFCMLIFAKAAYDCAIYFNTSYGEIIIYATLGLILFGAFAPLASYLSKVFSRKIGRIRLNLPELTGPMELGCTIESKWIHRY